MSNFSSFSTASRLALQEMSQKMASMQAILVANGLEGVLEGPDKLSQSSSGTGVVGAMVRPEPIPGTSGSRKRHCSQELARSSKDIRMVTTQNKYGLLDTAASYPDRSMKPASVISTPGASKLKQSTSKIVPGQSFANVVGALSSSTKNPKSPGERSSKPLLEAGGIYSINNEGALREEIEIEFGTINGEKFHGTITHREAKHCIFKECLGFGDYSNFDGARIGYKGAPVVTFKLKMAINVDELYPKQHFEFKRKSTRQGSTHVDVIGCKIRGLRRPDSVSDSTKKLTHNASADNGTKKILIQGCEYRIPRDVLVGFLANFGELTDELTEELFEDDDGGSPDTELGGTNRTGNYIARLKLRRDIPEWVPILGKRIKISYPGVSRMCTNCFGKHPKKSCHSRKISWPGYISDFKSKFPDVSVEIIDHLNKSGLNVSGTKNMTKECPEEAMEINENGSSQNYTNNWVNNLGVEVSVNQDTTESTSMNGANNSKPKKEDFLVPSNAEEHKSMVSRLVKAGTLPVEAEQIIAMRKNAFNKACREQKKLTAKLDGRKDSVRAAKKSPKNVPKTRKNVSLKTNEDDW